MSGWNNPDLVSFARALPDLRAGRSTPRELLERCLAAIEARDGTVKAFTAVDAAAARQAADAATRRYRRGAPLSPVDGCPVAVKDIIAAAGLPTAMNSPVYKDWIPRFDAAAVAALRRGGAVILGKTVTTEFAIGSSGPTTNPFNRNHTPGGSSSGSAAAVGAGMAPAALGTQTGGSILRPASYCGAIGFKPTIGTLHLGGVHPLSTTCDHLGVIAATLDDAWRVASQISLEAGGQGRRILPGPGGRLPAAVKPGKLIRLYTRGWRELDRGSQEAFDGLIVSLQAAGVVVEDRNSSARIARLEAELDAGVADGRSIVAYEMKWPYAEYAARFGRQMSPTIHGLLDLARRTRPATYDGWLRRRVRMQQQIEEAASGYAGFITLASSGPAPVGLRHTGSRTFQSYSSWLGLPAAALPLLRVDALPLGVQLMGRDGADRALFANARWLMRQFGEE